MRRVAFAIFLLLLTVRVPLAHAETRLALVIGNADYRQTTKLDNPVNDARLVAATLRRQQFDVSEHIDADLRQMRRALQAFFAKVERAGKDAVVVVYFAGHGVQVGGVNFLIPIDAEIDSESGVASDSIRADDIMQGVAQAGTRLNIVILDACRNNPFRGFRALTRGLAQIEAPTGTLVAFSTAPGRVARDGPKGGNSPYTAALVETVAEPGLKIEDVFKRVRQTVSAETRGEQVPWEASSLVGDFYPAVNVKHLEGKTWDQHAKAAAQVSPATGKATTTRPPTEGSMQKSFNCGEVLPFLKRTGAFGSRPVQESAYAEQVVYENRGRILRGEVINLTREYESRFPIRMYEIDERSLVIEPQPDGMCHIKFQYNYNVQNGTEERSGRAWREFSVRIGSGNQEIVREAGDILTRSTRKKR